MYVFAALIEGVNSEPTFISNYVSVLHTLLSAFEIISTRQNTDKESR